MYKEGPLRAIMGALSSRQLCLQNQARLGWNGTTPIYPPNRDKGFPPGQRSAHKILTQCAGLAIVDVFQTNLPMTDREQCLSLWEEELYGHTHTE